VAVPVLFVTGKGGTGKSAVATALAREAARRGQHVLLVRMQPAAERDSPPHQSPPRQSPAGGDPAGGLLRERTLDDRADLEAFLTRVLGLGMIARRLGESRTFSAVAAAAPGLRDLVALCAIFEEASGRAEAEQDVSRASRARERQRGLVVIDAPASGHSVPMLTAPAQALERAPIGPVAREASRALAVLADPHSFAAVLVTTPEELAITEVAELREQVTAAGVACARVVVNALWPAYVSLVDGDRIAASNASADAATHWRRHRRQAALVDELELAIGVCPRIGFAFDGEELPAADIAALLDSLPGGTA